MRGRGEYKHDEKAMPRYPRIRYRFVYTGETFKLLKEC